MKSAGSVAAFSFVFLVGVAQSAPETLASGARLCLADRRSELWD